MQSTDPLSSPQPVPGRYKCDEQVLSTVGALFLEHIGLKLASRDLSKLSHALKTRMEYLKIPEASLYLQKLIIQDTDRKELTQLACLLTNKESFFFRDKGQFAILQHELLPVLIREKNTTKKLRIWSAGCSTGEEPYSIALALFSILPDWRLWHLHIVGSDLCNSAIERAKTGIYSAMAFRSMEKWMVEKYFSKVSDTHWQINQQVRSIVRFQECNLVASPFPDFHSSLYSMDLILCRNVFIYFDHNAHRKVTHKFIETLAPGGYLMTGHGELHLIREALESMKTVNFRESVVYQKHLS